MMSPKPPKLAVAGSGDKRWGRSGRRRPALSCPDVRQHDPMTACQLRLPICQSRQILFQDLDALPQRGLH